ACMVEALELDPSDCVLEVGTGSGYAAAVLACIAREVHTIERHASLAETAAARLAHLGYHNVVVHCGDGTLGWPGAAPFDAIVVAAGGPAVPDELKRQLAIGGRMVIPVGEPRTQRLVRIRRVAETHFTEEDLGAVRFVPLVGAQGWAAPVAVASAPEPRGAHAIARLIAESCEPMADIEEAPLAGLLDRIGDARVVLIGEATHGSSEFYRMRARITRELVLRAGFRGVAIEGDWPDAARVDRYVRHRPPRGGGWRAFSRFPTWMWRNQETDAFVRWLREFNRERGHEDRAAFFGLDLYSMYTSMYEVIRYLDTVDPDLARIARERYGSLTPWQADPAAYGRAALRQRFGQCERAVVEMLSQLHQHRVELLERDKEGFVDAIKNAKLVADAERYYRVMYYGARESWNLRDQHMFDVLEAVEQHRNARIVVWAHNSHVGNAAATEMGAQREHNIGQLCRARYGDEAFLIGFGTDRGTVAAAHDWDEPMQVMRVVPSRADSYERLGHDSGRPAFLLHLRHPTREAVRQELSAPRLERAIGVVYRPETELQSHYFQAVLPQQFDEWIYFDESRAVTPIESQITAGMPETYPFGV
ncbi:MAG: erythromycin esterase family protein, partial [Polyangia bacterium]